MRDVYITAKDKALSQRKIIEDQFRHNYLAEFERRIQREVKRDEFSQYDLSSLELGLVNDEDLEETLKVNDMSAKLRRYCEEELNALDQRIGVLIGDANLQADGNPFSPQAVCNAYKQTCRTLESNMKIRMIFHKLFDDYVLDDVRSIYKDINALLIQRSILPKIRFGIRRGAGAIGRRPGVPGAQPVIDSAAGSAGVPGGAMPMGMNPMAAMGVPVGGMAHADVGDAGYGGDAGGGEQDFFSVLQDLIARSHAGRGSAWCSWRYRRRRSRWRGRRRSWRPSRRGIRGRHAAHSRLSADPGRIGRWQRRISWNRRQCWRTHATGQRSRRKPASAAFSARCGADRLAHTSAAGRPRRHRRRSCHARCVGADLRNHQRGARAQVHRSSGKQRRSDRRRDDRHRRHAVRSDLRRQARSLRAQSADRPTADPGGESRGAGQEVFLQEVASGAPHAGHAR